MKTARFFLLALAVSFAAHADFSYTMTSKSSGMMAAAGGQAAKYYLKGQKYMMDMNAITVIVDFDSQTVTTINKTQKTYTVTPFAQLAQMAGGAAMPDVQVDFKQTGEHKNINGFDASQAVMTMQMEMPQAQSEMKMQLEMEFWVSKDVPGAKELGAFYERNSDRFPWGAMGAGGNPNAKSAMIAMMKKLSGMNGVPVLQIVRVKSAGGGPQMSQAQQDRMAQARQQLEAMAARGGPQGDAAKQALARMGAMSGGSGGALSETTMEGSAYSTASIPDSVFAVPAGFQKTEK